MGVTFILLSIVHMLLLKLPRQSLDYNQLKHLKYLCKEKVCKNQINLQIGKDIITQETCHGLAKNFRRLITFKLDKGYATKN